MSTRRAPRTGIEWIATLLALALLSCVTVSVGAARAAQPVEATASTQPVAHSAGRGPIAYSAEALTRASRSQLGRALRRRRADASALRRDRRLLSRCLRSHPGRCGRLRRRVRGERSRLARAGRTVKRLQAHIASAKRFDAQPHAASVSAAVGSSFDEPFVKGIDTNIQGWGSEAVPQIANEMHTLGVDWAREDLEWSKVEPQPGVFDWSSFDQMVSAAQANGITVLPIVGYAPSWASPTDAGDYAAFVKAAVERYGPGTAANLRWWELWNEPYDSYAWSGHTPEPEAYAHDVVAAAQAARSIAPSVKLLIASDYDDSPQAGGSSPWQTTWIDDMFAAEPSLGKWIDGVSVHPYGANPSLPITQTGGWKDASGEWSFQRIDSARAKFLAHGVNVPFWITEIGWSTEEVSEAQQASDYADLIPQVAARPWVRALFPYCLREFEQTPNKESQYGLLKFGSWQPKAAFAVLQRGFASLS
ncbi:MAG TPA: beta-galactosidase [Solirubrobacteraceae bacterium]|jgi:hypothetical protein|nr:beta-galactosidase [Solirubrobacteraceae bacterium]